MDHIPYHEPRRWLWAQIHIKHDEYAKRQPLYLPLCTDAQQAAQVHRSGVRRARNLFAYLMQAKIERWSKGLHRTNMKRLSPPRRPAWGNISDPTAGPV